MRRVKLRPTVKADFLALQGEPPLFRCRCLTAVVDGRVIGIGGIVHAPDGTLWASVLMAPEARRYPVAIHRAGTAAIAMFRELGLRQVFAAADRNEKAGRWLLRLGFRRQETAGGEVFVWRPGS